MTENKIDVLVVKDEEGILRPVAGIWIDNEAGAIGRDNYLAKNKKYNDTVVKATLTEIL